MSWKAISLLLSIHITITIIIFNFIVVSIIIIIITNIILITINATSIIVITTMSNAGEAHLGPQAQPTGTHPPPLLSQTMLGTAQQSLEVLKRTDARTEVAKIQTVWTDTHLRGFLPGMGTGTGTGKGTGMQRAEITVTGRTKLRACMVWSSSQEFWMPVQYLPQRICW